MSRLTFICLCLFLVATTSAVMAVDTLSPGDRIRIWVKGEPELTLERVLDSNGNISYPLLGTVNLLGRSPVEAARQIAKALDDGYLREPLVQVSLLSRKSATNSETSSSKSFEKSPIVQDLSTEIPKVTATNASSKSNLALPSPCLIEIVDRNTGKGIASAAMLLGGKIYQSNRLGQMLIERPIGRIILLADGYDVVQGPIEEFLQVGPPNRIPITPIKIVDEVTVKVIDANTKMPLSGVEVRLNKMKIRTNSKGIFKVQQLEREFTEVELTKKGYRPTRKILDCKDPKEQIIQLIPSD